MGEAHIRAFPLSTNYSDAEAESGPLSGGWKAAELGVPLLCTHF